MDVLAYDEFGVGSSDESRGADPLVFVHGFTQTRRSWQWYVDRLADRHRIVTVDAPGHGDSRAADADLAHGADLVCAAAGRGTYVGYSMGGRLVLQLAVRRPGFVDRLVLIGATPGIVDDVERAERRRSDELLADRIVQVGVDAFLDEWLALPLFAGLDAEAAAVDDRRRNRAEDLAASLRNAGTGTQAPLWDDLSAIEVPVLLIVGEHDTKFRSIAEDMTARLPRPTLEVVQDAGHTAHLEQPERTLHVLERWLIETSTDP